MENLIKAPLPLDLYWPLLERHNVLCPQNPGWSDLMAAKAASSYISPAETIRFYEAAQHATVSNLHHRSTNQSIALIKSTTLKEFKA